MIQELADAVYYERANSDCSSRPDDDAMRLAVPLTGFRMVTDELCMPRPADCRTSGSEVDSPRWYSDIDAAAILSHICPRFPHVCSGDRFASALFRDRAVQLPAPGFVQVVERVESDAPPVRGACGGPTCVVPHGYVAGRGRDGSFFLVMGEITGYLPASQVNRCGNLVATADGI
jgi:hypothetical protein